MGVLAHNNFSNDANVLLNIVHAINSNSVHCTCKLLAHIYTAHRVMASSVVHVVLRSISTMKAVIKLMSSYDNR